MILRIWGTKTSNAEAIAIYELIFPNIDALVS